MLSIRSPAEAVCFECECVLTAGAEVLVCSGVCRRRFHVECETQESRKSSASCAKKKKAWECALCSLKVVRCSTCKGLELLEMAKFCCRLRCARALCTQCCVEGDWMCLSHECRACGKGLSTATSWVCVRCPVTYCEGCRPAASVVIADRVLKCVKHLKDPQLQEPDATIISEQRNAHSKDKRKRKQQAAYNKERDLFIKNTTKSRAGTACAIIQSKRSLLSCQPKSTTLCPFVADTIDSEMQQPKGSLTLEDMMRDALFARANKTPSRADGDEASRLFGLPSLGETLEPTDVALPPRRNGTVPSLHFNRDELQLGHQSARGSGSFHLSFHNDTSFGSSLPPQYGVFFGSPAIPKRSLSPTSLDWRWSSHS